jgi:amino acid transporter
LEATGVPEGEPGPAKAESHYEHVDKGLKANSIGFLDGLAIGLDSTAPAYSLAAVLGSIAVVAGVQAPAVLLVAFIPMFMIAGAFYYMNKADQDCGTSFSWVTRAMGPTLGWLGGWAIFVTGILVIGSLADVTAYYAFDIVGLDGLRDSRVAVISFAVLIIAVMTAICVIGTEFSAKVQRVLVFAQVGALLLFVVVAAIRLALGDVPARSIDPSLSWLNPFAISDYSALLSGMLLAVFIYWGWESAVNLTEESEDSARSPGLAGITSTVILLFTYITVAITMIAVAGLDKVARFDDDPGLFGAVADDVLGPFAFVLVLAIITSGLASTQTTILPASRTSLSMATAGAFPKIFSRIHPSFGTPDFGTIVIGVVATVWYVGASIVSENFLFDSLSALSLMIAFYYGLTGIACAIYWRRELRDSVKNFLLIGVGPVVGAIALFYLLYESFIDLANPEDSYSGDSVFGLGVPLAIALFFFILGLILMVIWRFSSYGRPFFSRRGWEAVPPEVARDMTLGPTAPGS